MTSHPSTFGQRLAYAAFIFHFETGEPPTNVDLARAAKRSGPSVTAWLVRETPPPFHEVRKPLAGYLGVSEAWLFDNEGDPPYPELWQQWRARRGRDNRGGDGHAAKTDRPQRPSGPYFGTAVKRDEPARKKGKGR